MTYDTFVYIFYVSTLNHPAPTEKRIEREAKLFETGEYPEKGVIVRDEDLAALALAFNSPVPLLIEHVESPLALGFLTKVRAEGNELFGTFAISAEANRLIESNGADSLSIGLSPDLQRIEEVSLVRFPRVPSARLFYGPVFHTKLPQNDAQIWQGRAEEADRRWQEVETERQVNEWLAEGRIVPAQVKFARTLMQLAEPVTFDGKSVAIGKVVRQLLESAPTVSRFRETAVPTAPPNQAMAAEHADFYRRHFPDLSLDEIAKRIAQA